MALHQPKGVTDVGFLASVPLIGIDPVEQARAVRAGLQSHAIVHIQPYWHIADLDDFYAEMIRGIGEPVTIGEDFRDEGRQTGDQWLEIRYDERIPDMAAFRYSKNSQPLHTDESYIRNPADIMFFYCVNQAPEGGATVFVHGSDVVACLRREDPALLAALMSTDLTYAKAEQSRTQRVISTDDQGQIFLNFNYFCIDPRSPQSHHRLNHQFHEFLEQHIAESELTHEVLLRPGEALAWWDHLVLHGRRPFSATKTNDRLIWKTGIRAS